MNIHCPACEGEIEISEDFFGEGLACPHCDHLFMLTAEGQVAEYEEAPAAAGGSNKKTAIIAIAVAVVAVGGFVALMMMGDDPARQSAGKSAKPAVTQSANKASDSDDDEALASMNAMAGGAPTADASPDSDSEAEVTMEPKPPVDIPDTADGAVNAVIQAFAAGNPRGIWDAMPASYQSDINRMVHQYAAAADRETADKGLQVAERLVGLLEDKQEFIFGNQMISGLPFKQGLEANWGKILAVLNTIADSELMHPDRMTDFDGGKFLGTTGARLIHDLSALTSLIPDPRAANAMQLLAASETRLLGETNGVATVEISGADTNEVLHLVKVEDRWIPRDMTNDWSKNVEMVIASFEEMKKAQEAMRAMQLQQLAQVEQVIGMFEGANDQQQFDGAVMQVFGIFAAMRGGPGGPGGPPPGMQGGMQGGGQFPPPPPPPGKGKGGQR